MMQKITAPAGRWLARARHAAAAALLLALPLAAQAQPLATLGNGETITPAEFSDYVSRRMDLRDAARTEAGARHALEEMALTRALTLEGSRLGMARRVDTEEDDRFPDIYAYAVYKRLAPACERPADDKAARAWFDAHPQAFVLPATVRVSRVILPLTLEVEGQSAMNWLSGQAAAIRQGKTTIEDVARQAEQVYRLDVQGDLGWVALEDTDGPEGGSAVIQALDAASPGDLLGPMAEGGLAYLLYVPDRRAARQLTWEQARSSVPQRAQVWCRARAREQLRDDLFRKYGVEIDNNAVRALFAADSRQQKAGS